MPQVTEYRLGNTTIRIFDDACRKEPSEVDAILRRIGQLASHVRTKPHQPVQREVK